MDNALRCLVPLSAYLAKGDVALSVTLTAFSSIITIFTIPFLASFILQHFMGESAAISLPIGSTMAQIFLIIVLPMVMGMTIRHYFLTGGQAS